MEAHKLTSITSHSDYLETLNISYRERWKLHCLRKDFGKKALELGDFVPCVNGVPMDEPSGMHCTSMDGSIESGRLQEQFQKAKSRVLFEGFEVGRAKGYVKVFNTIEDLIYTEPTLTETALKQIR